MKDNYDPREKMRGRQTQFLRALFMGDSAPSGIDSSRLSILRDSLLRKRAASISRRWPELRRYLDGENFDLFRRHCLATATEFRDDSLVDGLRFARWLAAQNLLDNEATRELVAAELAASRSPMVPRITARRCSSRRWVIGAMLPGRSIHLVGI